MVDFDRELDLDPVLDPVLDFDPDFDLAPDFDFEAVFGAVVPAVDSVFRPDRSGRGVTPSFDPLIAWMASIAATEVPAPPLSTARAVMESHGGGGPPDDSADWALTSLYFPLGH